MGKRDLMTYITVQGWMIREIGLDNKNELLIYATIFSFSQDGKSEYRGGRQYLADSLNITLSTLDRALDNLVAKNYIIKDQFMYGSMSCNSYKANLKFVEEFLIHDKYYMEKYSQNEYSHFDYCIQNDEGSIQNDEHIIKDNKKKVEGKPSTPAKLDSKTHPRNFHRETLTDDLNSLGEILEKEEKKKQKKKSLYEKCIDAIDEYGFDDAVKDRLKDFLPTTLQAKEYRVSGVNQWKYRLKSLLELSNNPKRQIEIIEYSISHSLTGFVNKTYSSDKQKHELGEVYSTPIEVSKAKMAEKIAKGVKVY